MSSEHISLDSFSRKITHRSNKNSIIPSSIQVVYEMTPYACVTHNLNSIIGIGEYEHNFIIGNQILYPYIKYRYIYCETLSESLETCLRNI